MRLHFHVGKCFRASAGFPALASAGLIESRAINMRNKFYYWRYLGLDKKDVLQYEEPVRCENILFLRSQCLFIWIVTYAVGLVFLLNLEMFRKGIVLLCCGSVFMILYFLIRDAVSHIQTVTARHAAALVIAFAVTLFVITGYIGTFASGGRVAVTVVAVLLFIQVDVDILPEKNFVCAVLGFATFAVCSYLTKTQENFVLDMLDATMGTTLGMFVSWQKAKNKWEYVIAQGKLREINYELYHASVTDELTKLPNRRQAFDSFRKLSRRCAANGTVLACLIMDIDQFKQFNDTYGHPQGDRLLESIGGLLLRFARRSDLQVGRIGGEEFMFFWEDDDLDHVFSIAESVRLSVQSVPHPDSDKGAVVTVSIGVCARQPDSDFDTEDAYREADNAMYCAKRSGKNSCWRYYDEAGKYAPLLPVEKNA